MPRSRPVPGPRRLAVVAAVAALVAPALAVVPAGAEPPADGPAPAATPTPASLPGSPAANGAAVPGELAGPTVVTLLTGDVVRLVPAGAGRMHVRYQPVDPAAAGYETRTVGKDVYVIPDAAAAPIGDGTVDDALFNVSALVRQGYDDASTPSIPVITTYDDRARAAGQAAPKGSTRTRVLTSVGAAALRTDKAQARSSWQALTSATDPAGRGVKKVWLDAKVRSTLDESVPAVRAPQAWEAGFDGTGSTVAVLDSGVDAEHPDLAGTIDAQQNFTDSPGVGDVDGHGTHVASTVLGSGAASAGKNKGVAPGARLLSGKVLSDQGSGALSWIVAGMEWAVAQGADVISMSIGTSEPVDCTDPMAEAVDRLSASSDALFVVAAGNLGGPAEMITSPGCASSALTVAATDLAGTTASFSGRGPVLGNHAVKPDIAAPGVAITAARAGGRGDSAYTDKNGTSMATPHVAGAAAILKQRRPELDGEALKAALQSSVRGASTVSLFEQGAGILDVANAVRNPVTGPGTTDLGTFAWPHTPDQKVTEPLAYRNSGTEPVELTFAVDARGHNGKPLPATTVSLGATTLTVPAGGTAEVPLVVDPSAPVDGGLYGAASVRIVATGNDGSTVVTAAGFYFEPKHVDVTFRLLDRNGNPASTLSSLDVFDLDSIAAQRIAFKGADQTLHLRAGTYSLLASIATAAGSTLADTLAYLGDPEISLTEDTTITFDARTAGETKVSTQRPSVRKGGSITYGRVIDQWVLSLGRAYDASVRAVYLGTSGKATRGTFELVEGWQLTAPTGARKPYVYSLAFTHHGGLEGAPARTVRDRELATVVSTYHTPGKAYAFSEYIDVYRPWSIYMIETGRRRTVAGPTKIEHLVTAEADTRVSQMVGHSDAMMWSFGTMMTSPPKVYQPGSRHAETWFKSGLRPGLAMDPASGEQYSPAQRDGNRIWTNFPAWADTEPGHYAWQGFLDLGSTELFANGVSLGRYGFYGQGGWDVPAEATDFELEYHLNRWQRTNYSWETPSDAVTRWRFRSGGDQDATKLPVLFPEYDLDVDKFDRAPRVPAFDVRVGVESGPWYTPGAITAAKAWVSYDGEATWVEAPVRPDGDRQVVTVDNTKAAAGGGFVSLRVDLTDANGVGVNQTLTSFYAVN